MIDGDWKLVQLLNRNTNRTTNSLYMIFSDPYEQKDLAAEYPEVLQEMLAKLAASKGEPIAGTGQPGPGQPGA